MSLETSVAAADFAVGSLRSLGRGLREVAAQNPHLQPLGIEAERILEAAAEIEAQARDHNGTAVSVQVPFDQAKVAVNALHRMWEMDVAAAQQGDVEAAMRALGGPGRQAHDLAHDWGAQVGVEVGSG